MNETFLKCKDNIFDLAKYTYVQHNDNTVRLSPRGYQRKVMSLLQLPSICRGKQGIILKQPRQTGATTELLVFIMHKLLFEPNASIIIAATKYDRAADLMSRLTFSINNFPPEWFDDGLSIGFNKYDIVNNINNSVVSVVPYNAMPTIDRNTANYILLDDFAFAPDASQRDVLNKVVQSMDSQWTTPHVIVSSATNGKKNMFHKICVDAMDVTSPFLMVEIPWWETFNFNVKEMRRLAHQLGERRWMAEYGMLFDG